jgi:hypothetical protein
MLVLNNQILIKFALSLNKHTFGVLYCKIDVQFSAGTDFSVHRIQTASYPMHTRGSFLGVKWLRDEADHLHPGMIFFKLVWGVESNWFHTLHYGHQ